MVGNKKTGRKKGSTSRDAEPGVGMIEAARSNTIGPDEGTCHAAGVAARAPSLMLIDLHDCSAVA